MHYNPEKRAWRGKSYKKSKERVSEIRERSAIETDKKILCGHCGGGGSCGHCNGTNDFTARAKCKECDGEGYTSH